jgi:hypothetical protein
VASAGGLLRMVSPSPSSSLGACEKCLRKGFSVSEPCSRTRKLEDSEINSSFRGHFIVCGAICRCGTLCAGLRRFCNQGLVFCFYEDSGDDPAVEGVFSPPLHALLGSCSRSLFSFRFPGRGMLLRFRICCRESLVKPFCR